MSTCIIFGCACACMLVEVRGKPEIASSGMLSACFGVLSLIACNTPVKLGWLASGVRGASDLILSSAGLTSVLHHTQYFYVSSRHGTHAHKASSFLIKTSP